jgi:hypothetical protein
MPNFESKDGQRDKLIEISAHKTLNTLLRSGKSGDSSKGEEERRRIL